VRTDEVDALRRERDAIDASLSQLTPQIEALRVIFTH